MNQKSLITKMNEEYSGMSKGQRKLATFITDHIDRAAFLTADGLGEAAGVSESTVVRFASFLGFEGYAKLQEAMADLVHHELISGSFDNSSDLALSENDHPDQTMYADMRMIGRTLEQIDESVISSAAELIDHAETVYIVGLRNCMPLADYLGYYLGLMRNHVTVVKNNSMTELCEQMVHVSGNDAVIGISFPRYSMSTLKMMELANDRSASVITVTDSIHSPMNLYSSCNLVAETESAPLVFSPASAFSLLHRLLLKYALLHEKEYIANLEFLENAADNYGVFGGEDIDPLEDSIRYRTEQNHGVEEK